jgi:hypothetical protein
MQARELASGRAGLDMHAQSPRPRRRCLIQSNSPHQSRGRSVPVRNRRDQQQLDHDERHQGGDKSMPPKGGTIFWNGASTGRARGVEHRGQGRKRVDPAQNSLHEDEADQHDTAPGAAQKPGPAAGSRACTAVPATANGIAHDPVHAQHHQQFGQEEQAPGWPSPGRTARAGRGAAVSPRNPSRARQTGRTGCETAPAPTASRSAGRRRRPARSNSVRRRNWAASANISLYPVAVAVLAQQRPSRPRFGPRGRQTDGISFTPPPPAPECPARWCRPWR